MIFNDKDLQFQTINNEQRYPEYPTYDLNDEIKQMPFSIFEQLVDDNVQRVSCNIFYKKESHLENESY